MLSVKERLQSVKQACSRTIQTSGANRFVGRAHHRRCAREGLTGSYDASDGVPVASFEAMASHCSDTEYILEWQYMLVDNICWMW